MSVRPGKESHLGIVNGGRGCPRFDTGEGIDRLDMSLLAADLSGSLKEAEQRIGLLLSGNLGDLLESQKLALGSAGNALASLGLFVSLLGMNNRGTGETRIQETFDLCALLRTTADTIEPAARAKGINIRLHLPEIPMIVRTWREGVESLLRFVLRERLRVSPVWERIRVIGETSRGVHSIAVHGSGSIDLRGTVPHSGIALARSILNDCGGSLLLPNSGSEWFLTFPVPRRTRKKVTGSSFNQSAGRRSAAFRTRPSFR